MAWIRCRRCGVTTSDIFRSNGLCISCETDIYFRPKK